MINSTVKYTKLIFRIYCTCFLYAKFEEKDNFGRRLH